MSEKGNPDFGALVGWTAEATSSRVMLKLQSVDKPPPHEREDVHTLSLMMDHNQAVQLGNYLFELTNQTSPWKEERRKKKGLIEKLMGV